MSEIDISAKYLRSCKNDFWRRVFAEELAYLRQHLHREDKVLSVGCGPAILETALHELGFSVVGLDVSEEAIACAPDGIRTVVASAEKMPLPNAAFDVVLFIASLQFIENYRRALAEAGRVLKPKGRIISLLLNPASDFFKKKNADPNSYVRLIKHPDLRTMESALSENFAVHGEYFLGIENERIFPSRSPETAALYVLHGIKV
ncbi:MAG: class I SAM-dependent methyltransferase [Deltaproteobacteria bacterium]|nr:class I SAM-dependent methyltransferase [Deltaproteobacteria bacterium]